jgi:hypothetical protein
MYKNTVEIQGDQIEIHISVDMSKGEIEAEAERLGSLCVKAMFFPNDQVMANWLSQFSRIA